jgi:hypothetical protein
MEAHAEGLEGRPHRAEVLANLGGKGPFILPGFVLGSSICAVRRYPLD